MICWVVGNARKRTLELMTRMGVSFKMNLFKNVLRKATMFVVKKNFCFFMLKK